MAPAEALGYASTLCMAMGDDGKSAPAASALVWVEELRQLAASGSPHVELRHLGDVGSGAQCLPLLALMLGSRAPEAPAIGFFGGVHGLERIGTEVVMAYLRSLVMRLRWDSLLHQQLAGMRMVFMPLVNPGGLERGTRANPQGVDLMRNAPVEALGPAPWLVAGQRLSPSLPWYRGASGAAMAPESLALCALVREELLTHQIAMTVDCHSGFGLRDRIWFPFAHTAKPIEHLPEMHALCEILDQTHAQHHYLFEPQSRQYLTHGDLWDYLYLQSRDERGQMLLPLTLEMGSWLWVKKNPRQLFSRLGIFNPQIQHRRQRVLRRHVAWLDFMSRAASSAGHWLPRGDQRRAHYDLAVQRWYRR